VEVAISAEQGVHTWVTVEEVTRVTAILGVSVGSNQISISVVHPGLWKLLVDSQAVVSQLVLLGSLTLYSTRVGV
jgi:hypothetical protein